LRRLLSDPEILFPLRIFAKKPRTFQDIERGLEAKTLLKEKYKLDYMKRVHLVGGNARNKFFRRLDNHLSSMYYQKSCYGDGDMAECFQFTADELKTVKRLFLDSIHFAVWSGSGGYLELFPWEVMKLLLDTTHKREVARGIVELMEGFHNKKYNYGITRVFDVVECREEYSQLVLDCVKTDAELEAFKSLGILDLDEDEEENEENAGPEGS
jgi:hypothetical protein